MLFRSSEDVCTYVKCDIGMLKSGNVGPTGVKLPNPDLLLLSYTGCFTFLKWFELLRQEYQCPVAMLHVPYLANGRIEPHHVDYVVKQLRTEVIPKLEQVSGRRYDEARLSEMLALSAKAEDDFVWVLESAKNEPSPIDAYFGGVYYIGPIFTAFRGTSEGVEYYHVLREEIAERIKLGLGPVTPEGTMERQRYRLVVEGPPNWTSFREFWKMFYDEGAVVVASSYTKVGGLYDRGFRHDPNRPLESLAEYCLAINPADPSKRLICRRAYFAKCRWRYWWTRMSPGKKTKTASNASWSRRHLKNLRSFTTWWPASRDSRRNAATSW